MTKKKGKILSLVALVLFLGASMLYAYSAGYCLKADCRCHQYVGDDERHQVLEAAAIADIQRLLTAKALQRVPCG